MTFILFRTPGRQTGEKLSLIHILEKTDGICGVFVGSKEQGFRYVLGKKDGSICSIGKCLNEAFEGKGGGKPPMIQGSLKGNPEAIRGFLEKE